MSKYYDWVSRHRTGLEFHDNYNPFYDRRRRRYRAGEVVHMPEDYRGVYPRNERGVTYVHPDNLRRRFQNMNRDMLRMRYFDHADDRLMEYADLYSKNLKPGAARSIQKAWKGYRDRKRAREISTRRRERFLASLGPPRGDEEVVEVRENPRRIHRPLNRVYGPINYRAMVSYINGVPHRLVNSGWRSID